MTNEVLAFLGGALFRAIGRLFWSLSVTGAFWIDWSAGSIHWVYWETESSLWWIIFRSFGGGLRASKVHVMRSLRACSSFAAARTLVKTSVVDPEPDPHRFGRLDPDPDPGGQNGPQKKNSVESSCFEVLDVLFWGLKAFTELGRPSWGQGIKIKKFFYIKNTEIFFVCKNVHNFYTSKPWIQIRVALKY